MKIHQISNTAKAYVASKLIWKNILLKITKQNSLDLFHSEGFSDWLASC